MEDRNKKGSDFILGNKAADLWLFTCDACANDKVVPRKYRYTTGTGLMNAAEEICDLIEIANLLDLREHPAERLRLQRRALAVCEKFGRKILRMLESKQYPRREPPQGGGLEQAAFDRSLYVRELVQQGPGTREARTFGCPAAIAALH